MPHDARLARQKTSKRLKISKLSLNLLTTAEEKGKMDVKKLKEADARLAPLVGKCDFSAKELEKFIYTWRSDAATIPGKITRDLIFAWIKPFFGFN